MRCAVDLVVMSAAPHTRASCRACHISYRAPASRPATSGPRGVVYLKLYHKQWREKGVAGRLVPVCSAVVTRTSVFATSTSFGRSQRPASHQDQRPATCHIADGGGGRVPLPASAPSFHWRHDLQLGCMCITHLSYKSPRPRDPIATAIRLYKIKGIESCCVYTVSCHLYGRYTCSTT